MVEQQKAEKTSSRYAFEGFLSFQSRLTKTVQVDENLIRGTLDGTRLVNQDAWKDAPHKALANLKLEPKSLEMFVKRHGVLHRAAIADDLSFAEPIKAFADAQTLLRDVWKGRLLHLDSISREMKNGFALETVRVRSKKVVLTTEDLWKFICFLFLRDHKAGKLGYCANPDCPAPYFLKQRRTQKFCELGPCTAFAQRQYALKWWTEKGSSQRARKERQ